MTWSTISGSHHLLSADMDRIGSESECRSESGSESGSGRAASGRVGSGSDKAQPSV